MEQDTTPNSGIGLDTHTEAVTTNRPTLEDDNQQVSEETSTVSLNEDAWYTISNHLDPPSHYFISTTYAVPLINEVIIFSYGFPF